MRRLSLWLQAHPLVGDCVIAACLAVFELLSLFDLPGGVNAVVFWLVGVGLLGPLVIRRRNPVLSAYMVMTAGYAQLLTHGVPDNGHAHSAVIRIADVALGISLYTLVAYAGRWHAVRYAVLPTRTRWPSGSRCWRPNGTSRPGSPSAASAPASPASCTT
jgi:hypothetical protein